jgi:uncharacterized peroxidase-related enzyme
MSWIHVIAEDQAEGTLSEVYDRIARTRGRVSNIMRVQSLAPGAMAAHMDLYLELMFSKGGLSRAERELVAVVVSMANRCEYCTLHHAAALEAWWKDAERVERLKEDPAGVDLSPRERALARYARTLTLSPVTVEAEDVERLRGVGLSDEEILQVNMITAYFNFVNRIAVGLGVEAPAEEVGGYRY